MPPKISLEIEIEPSGNAGGLENDAEEMDEDEPEEKRRGGAVRKKSRKAAAGKRSKTPAARGFKKGGSVQEDEKEAPPAFDPFGGRSPATREAMRLRLRRDTARQQAEAGFKPAAQQVASSQRDYSRYTEDSAKSTLGYSKGGAVRARGAGCAVRGSRVCKRY